MTSADTALKSGNFTQAIDLYRHAGEKSGDFVERASAAQCEGIAYRLNGDLHKSRSSLFSARSYAISANDIVLQGRIERDLGMTILDNAVINQNQVLFNTAHGWFESSLLALVRYSRTEAAATLGFIGRALLEEGLRYQAVETLRDAHRTLKGRNDVYELNNLVWMAKASVLDRWRYAPRAFWLMKRSGSTRRVVEYVVLLAGGNRLYKLLRNKYRK